MFKFVALAILLAISGSDAFWTGCNVAGVITPRDITSAACSGNICTVTRGQPLLAQAFATFTRAHARLDVRVTAFIFGIGVNLPQDPPHDNACNSLTLNGNPSGCPTTPNVEKIWTINLLIPTTYPTFSNTRVRFELVEDGAVVACADVQATLT